MTAEDGDRDDDDELIAIADELYAVPLQSFVAERTARARSARQAGDRGLASGVGALPKPSTAAWLVNRLVREGGDDVQRLLELSTALRRAQDESDRAALRGLTAERRDLLGEAGDRASERAERAGQRVGASVLEEFQQTLQAALVDEDALAAVRTGRLVRALRSDGLGPVEVDDAVAGGSGPPPRPEPPAQEPAHDESASARARRRDDAERLAAESDRRAADARREADDAATRAQDAEHGAQDRSAAVGELTARFEDLRARLTAAESDLAAARQAAGAARDAADTAGRAAAGATAEAEAAASALRELDDG